MKRRLCVLLPIIILGSLIVWRLDQKKAEVAGQAAQRSARMNGSAIASLYPVTVRDITHTFEATGSVEAPMNVKIAPKITGRIDYLKVREGDRVKKGQVLVRVDSSDVEANARQAMASLAEAQYRLAQAQMGQNPTDVAINTQIRQQKAGVSSTLADYNQVRKNYDAQLAAASANLTDAQSKIENAKAAVGSAQANLENAKVKFSRIESLYKQGFIAAQDVDDAKAAVTVQELAMEIAQGQLRSARAQKDVVQQQYSIVKEKGLADIEASKAKTVQARASLDYAQANTSSKSAYRQSIAALHAQVDAARASLESAKAKRRDTVLISPLDGYVTGRYADPGAIASPTQPILAVQFVKQVWVTVAVPEDVCLKIHIGQPATIKFDALAGRTFSANVVQINPSADSQSRQFTVRVIMSNTQGQFKPGMFAHVSIETDKIPKAVVVPREAVKRDKLGAYVMTVGRDKKAERIDITPGAEDENFVEVGDAIKPSTMVITMSAMPVREGQNVMAGGGKHNGFGHKPSGAGAR